MQHTLPRCWKRKVSYRGYGNPLGQSESLTVVNTHRNKKITVENDKLGMGF